jgi:hypothetical protein
LTILVSIPWFVGARSSCNVFCDALESGLHYRGHGQSTIIPILQNFGFGAANTWIFVIVQTGTNMCSGNATFSDLMIV